MSYAYLLIAILAEVCATTALKSAESFTRLVPSLIVIAGYSLSFYMLSLCLKTMKVAVAYAIWSGLGIVLIALLALVFHKQKIDLAGMAGIGLIIAGVLVVNTLSDIQIQ